MDPDRDLNLKALLRAIADAPDELDEDLEDDEPEEEPMSPFGLRLSVALRAAVDQMRGEGMLEVEEDLVEPLIHEVTHAGLESNSPKQLMKKVIESLIQSERVEEIYGTDEMLKATLSRFLGA